jgi:Right handed beta helix region
VRELDHRIQHGGACRYRGYLDRRAADRGQPQHRARYPGPRQWRRRWERFFGNGHRITENTITDISDRGYANPPHPDCFQTYDDNSPPTFDVLIAGNTCRNVGAQCLIATGDQRANSGAPSGGPSITFVDNACANNGAQAVNIRRWPNVEIRDNRFSGRNVARGIILVEGSTGSVVIGNTTTGGRPTVDIDNSSQPGSRVEHNSPG